MSDDLLTRMRAIERFGAPSILSEAIVEIERQRERIIDLQAIYKALFLGHETDDKIHRLCAERDEARRWFCCMFSDARAEANKRGWDCFKEATDER